MINHELPTCSKALTQLLHYILVKNSKNTPAHQISKQLIAPLKTPLVRSLICD